MSAKKPKSVPARLLAALVVIVVILLAVFLIGRYGWKLGGFRACESAGIEQVEVTDDLVTITGFYPGSFPEGFLGCYTRETDGKLYVGFKFSGLFGFLETGDFTVSIPVKGEIREVIAKTRMGEYPIWSAENAQISEDAPGDDTGDASDSAPSPEETPTTLEAYATVIGEYYTVLDEHWDAAAVLEAGLNYMVADSFFTDPLEEIGYAVTDLDGDGREELAIGSLVEDEFFGKMIFSLYTLDSKGEPKLLFDGTERNRYYYAGGFRFANLGSSGWNESFVTTLKLEDQELIDMTYTTDPADYVQMELTPFSQWVK